MIQSDEPILAFSARWSRRHRTFAPGANDCALYCATWVDENNGTQYVQRIQSDWSGPRAVLQTMAEPGAFRRAIISLVGEPTAEVGEERAGDVVLILNNENADTLAIAGASDFAYGIGPHGGYAGINRRDRVLAVWRLECLQ